MLPEQTQDDVDRGWGDDRRPDDTEEAERRWLEENRPPHWDRD